MSMNPAHRLLQLGVNSLGFDPGPVDGWWGPRTAAAGHALYVEGPRRRTEWAVIQLERGLLGLGYMQGEPAGTYDAKVRTALGMLLDADGQHMASAITGETPPGVFKPPLRPVQHGNKMLQGSARTVIDTFCLHCAAVPGDWHQYKTNAEIAQAIHQMHTLPVSKGGRGWSDTGYHSIGMPDGEVVMARPWSRYGAGAVGHNVGTYHHLMIEVATITKTGLPEDYFTDLTLEATSKVIADVSDRTPIQRLMGHREVAAKLCPGFDVIDRDWTDRAVS